MKRIFKLLLLLILSQGSLAFEQKQNNKVDDASIGGEFFHNGGEVDNGGELIALNFTKQGFEILSALKKLGRSEAILNLSEITRLEHSIIHTRVDAVSGPLLDNSGRIVDARVVKDNNKPIIEIDEKSWLQFFGSSANTYRLIFHEYLRVTGINDDNYRISARLNEDTVSKILGGAPILNPNSVSGQTPFEQLGDYFHLASIANITDLLMEEQRNLDDGEKQLWQGFCARSDMSSYTTAYSVDGRSDVGGPIFKGVFKMNSLHHNSLYPTFLSSQFDTVNDSSYIDYELIMKTGHTSESFYYDHPHWFFRANSTYIFLEMRSEKNQPAAIGERCYFWLN